MLNCYKQVKQFFFSIFFYQFYLFSKCLKICLGVTSGVPEVYKVETHSDHCDSKNNDYQFSFRDIL